MVSRDKQIISFQIDSELKAALHRLAEADDRSLSPHIKLLLQAHVKSFKTFRGRKTTERKGATNP
jgi:hypothetical protein